MKHQYASAGPCHDLPRVEGRLFAGWVPALGTWLAMVAVLGSTAWWGIIPLVEPGVEPAAKDRPFAELAQEVHDASVYSLAFSPRGTVLASGTDTGDVWLRDVASGRTSRILHGSLGSAWSLAFSPDGRTLAVAGSGPAVRLYDVEGGGELPPLEVGGETAKCVAFSADGTSLAVGTAEGRNGGRTVTLWDRADRRRLAVLVGRGAGINAIAIAPDGARLASGDAVGVVTLWDVATGRERATLSPTGRSHEGGIVALAFSPDGARLAALASGGSAVRLWDASSGAPRGEVTTTALGVNAFAFSPDGARLALAQDDGTAAVREVASGRVLGAVRAPGRPLRAVAFSDGGRALATGGADGILRLWDAAQALGAGSSVGP